MPGFNQKGPMGEGPMTGRKMGKCTNFGAKNVGSVEEPTDENLVIGRRGLGMRRCFGLGRGRSGQGFGRAGQSFEAGEGQGLAQRRGLRRGLGRDRAGQGFEEGEAQGQGVGQGRNRQGRGQGLGRGRGRGRRGFSQ
ncbi:MAG TPA: DUF5320 domain-containing protein [Bacteroidaceae bacterium]|jgi:hypothetical protein|nr:DUF5320 domain-containing protein [Bacteroidaceae bacterium]